MITVPPRRDTLAIYAVYGLLALMLYAGVRQIERPADNAQAQDIIIMATPTPALPTAAPAIAPIVDALPTPAWTAPAAAPATEPPPAAYSGAPSASGPEIGAGGPGDYIANVGAQAPHSPRGDVAPPVDEPVEDNSAPDGCPFPIVNGICGNGVLAKTVPDDDAFGSKPIADSPDPQHSEPLAVAVPPISDAQAAIIGARTSATCPAGQVFYPRTGCHLEGSGGPMPGAVGEETP